MGGWTLRLDSIKCVGSTDLGLRWRPLCSAKMGICGIPLEPVQKGASMTELLAQELRRCPAGVGQDSVHLDCS